MVETELIFTNSPSYTLDTHDVSLLFPKDRQDNGSKCVEVESQFRNRPSELNSNSRGSKSSRFPYTKLKRAVKTKYLVASSQTNSK